MTSKYKVDEHLRNHHTFNENNSYTMSPFNSSNFKDADNSPFTFDHENMMNYYDFSQVPMASTFEKKVDEYLKTNIVSKSNRKTRPLEDKFYTALPEIKNQYKDHLKSSKRDQQNHFSNNNNSNWIMDRSHSVIQNTENVELISSAVAFRDDSLSQRRRQSMESYIQKQKQLKRSLMQKQHQFKRFKQRTQKEALDVNGKMIVRKPLEIYREFQTVNSDQTLFRDPQLSPQKQQDSIKLANSRFNQKQSLMSLQKQDSSGTLVSNRSQDSYHNDLDGSIMTEKQREDMFKAVVMSGISNRKLSKRMEQDAQKRQTIKHYFIKQRKAFNQQDIDPTQGTLQKENINDYGFIKNASQSSFTKVKVINQSSSQKKQILRKISGLKLNKLSVEKGDKGKNEDIQNIYLDGLSIQNLESFRTLEEKIDTTLGDEVQTKQANDDINQSSQLSINPWKESQSPLGPQTKNIDQDENGPNDDSRNQTRSQDLELALQKYQDQEAQQSKFTLTKKFMDEEKNVLDEPISPQMATTERTPLDFIDSNFSSGPVSPSVLLPRALGIQMKLNERDNPHSKNYAQEQENGFSTEEDLQNSNSLQGPVVKLGSQSLDNRSNNDSLERQEKSGLPSNNQDSKNSLEIIDQQAEQDYKRGLDPQSSEVTVRSKLTRFSKQNSDYQDIPVTKTGAIPQSLNRIKIKLSQQEISNDHSGKKPAKKSSFDFEESNFGRSQADRRRAEIQSFRETLRRNERIAFQNNNNGQPVNNKLLNLIKMNADTVVKKLYQQELSESILDTHLNSSYECFRRDSPKMMSAKKTRFGLMTKTFKSPGPRSNQKISKMASIRPQISQKQIYGGLSQVIEENTRSTQEPQIKLEDLYFTRQMRNDSIGNIFLQSSKNRNQRPGPYSQKGEKFYTITMDQAFSLKSIAYQQDLGTYGSNLEDIDRFEPNLGTIPIAEQASQEPLMPGMINVESVENMTFNFDNPGSDLQNEPMADSIKSGLINQVDARIFDQLLENESQVNQVHKRATLYNEQTFQTQNRMNQTQQHEEQRKSAENQHPETHLSISPEAKPRVLDSIISTSSINNGISPTGAQLILGSIEDRESIPNTLESSKNQYISRFELTQQTIKETMNGSQQTIANLSTKK